MSMPHETTVDCGGCGATQPFVVWKSLNVTLNKAEKQELLSGRLTRFKCPKCGWSSDVLYPLLYHDMEQHLMVWLFPGQAEPDTTGSPFGGMMEEYRHRLVRTRNELIEKVLIFDAGLDDRVVEFFKLVLYARAGQTGQALAGELFFGKSLTDESMQEVLRFEHLREGRAEALTVPKMMYSKVASLLAEILPGAASEGDKWLAVDRRYASALLEKLNG